MTHFWGVSHTPMRPRLTTPGSAMSRHAHRVQLVRFVASIQDRGVLPRWAALRRAGQGSDGHMAMQARACIYIVCKTWRICGYYVQMVRSDGTQCTVVRSNERWTDP